MKLRIARKMDQRPPHAYPNKRRDDRVWWQVYNVEQLKRAEKRLRKAWSTHTLRGVDTDGKSWRKTNPDYFAAYRVLSRRERQAALRRHRASKTG